MSREHEDVRSVGSVEPRGRPEILIVIAGARAHSSCEGRHEFGSGRARTGTESEASTVHVCFGQQEWSRHCMRVLGNRDFDGPRPRSARGTASHGRRNIKARALSTWLHLSCSTPTTPPRTPSTLLNRRHARHDHGPQQGLPHGQRLQRQRRPVRLSFSEDRRTRYARFVSGRLPRGAGKHPRCARDKELLANFPIRTEPSSAPPSPPSRPSSTASGTSPGTKPASCCRCASCS